MVVKTMDGNEACAKSAYMFSDIAGIYPITPSSTMLVLILTSSRPRVLLVLLPLLTTPSTVR